jgi:plastocyanin
MVKRFALVGLLSGLVTSFAGFAPASAGGGGCHADQTTTARETTIIMSQACFIPNFARVNVGDTVTWVNKDQMTHTVTGVNLAWGSLKDMNVDDRVSMRFTKAGTYPYYCIYHPGMAGAVLVGDANALGAVGKIADVTSTVSQIDTSSAQRASSTVPATKSAGSTSGGTIAGIASIACLAGFGAGRVRRSRVGRSGEA